MTQCFSDLMAMQAVAGAAWATPAGGGGFQFGGLTTAMALTAAGTTVARAWCPCRGALQLSSFGRLGPSRHQVRT